MNTIISESICIIWFRRDLRLHDNTALYHAIQSGRPLLPLFIVDTGMPEQSNRSCDRQMEFVHRTVHELHARLRTCGSGLLVRAGRPLDIFRTLMQEYTVEGVYANEEYEPYAVGRDAGVAALLAEQGSGLFLFKDHVIRAGDEVLTGAGTTFRVFTPYKKKWQELLRDSDVQPRSAELSGIRFVPVPQEPPSLEDLGLRATGVRFPAPYIAESVIRQYAQRRDIPALDGTSHLGVHLRFGTISIREVIARALELSDTWLNELVWREFFTMILRQHPHVVNRCFRPEFEAVQWRNDDREFRLWCEGKTGYPLVDAGMRQLNETGFMPNRVRMVTAGFLVKDLLVDWRWGETYFASKLLDYEPASNNGNWQWVAGTGCDAAPYFRVFHPETQRKKFDPDDTYCRRWLPELGTPEYPAPVVDHAEARKRALQVYADALREISPAQW